MKYYIQVQSVNLGHYMRGGMILPVKYLSSRNADIQDKFNHGILLGSSKFTSETNCALEVVFDEKSEKPFKISANFYFYEKPLPISRIRQIYFNSEDQKIRTMFNVNSGDGFLPEKLVSVVSENEIDVKELNDVILPDRGIDWSEHLKLYDHYLGGFAMMRIALNEMQNYPTHYFSTLANVNTIFSSILLEQKINIPNAYGFIFKNDNKGLGIKNLIFSDVNTNIVNEYASKEGLRIETRNALILLEKIPENKVSYLLSILDTYGPGKRKEVDTFISDILSGKIAQTKKEGVSLLFGVNKGYNAFRNKYRTLNFEAIVKFELNSKLDYYIIESVFQYVFNSITYSSEYLYIDSWCPMSSENTSVSFDYKFYKVFDKTVVYKKKEDSFTELYHSLWQEREVVYNKVANAISEWFPSYFDVRNSEISSFISSLVDAEMQNYTRLICDSVKRFNNVNSDIDKVSTNGTNSFEDLKDVNSELKNSTSDKNQISDESIISHVKNSEKPLKQKKGSKKNPSAKSNSEPPVDEVKSQEVKDDTTTEVVDNRKKIYEELSLLKSYQLMNLCFDLKIENYQKLNTKEMIQSIITRRLENE